MEVANLRRGGGGGGKGRVPVTAGRSGEVYYRIVQFKRPRRPENK